MFKPTGELKLTFKRKQNGKTYMANQYYALPLQVLPPYYPDEDGTAFVYLLNPTGGILQGDRLLTEVTVEDSARTMITTPSANKFYKMEEDHAELVNSFRVKDGAVLEYIPEYGIPYAKSKVYQENTFHLRENSVLIASDMVTPGRVDRGECLQYDLYSSKTKIYVEDRLLAYEYAKLSPSDERLTGIGVLEGHTIYASMFVYKKNLPTAFREESEHVISNGLLVGGISYITEDLASVRLLGNSVETVQEAILAIWGLARKHLLGKESVRIRRY